MVKNIFKKMEPKNSKPDEVKEITEIRKRLIGYIKSTSENFSLMNDRLNKMQEKVDAISGENVSRKDIMNIFSTYSDRLNKIQEKVDAISGENVSRKDVTSIFSIFSDRLNKIQEEVDALSGKNAGSKDAITVENLEKMELKIAGLSKAIAHINDTINIHIKGFLNEIYQEIHKDD